MNEWMDEWFSFFIHQSGSSGELIIVVSKDVSEVDKLIFWLSGAPFVQMMCLQGCYPVLTLAEWVICMAERLDGPVGFMAGWIAAGNGLLKGCLDYWLAG